MYYRNRKNEIINLSKTANIFVLDGTVIAGFSTECLNIETFKNDKKAIKFLKWISTHINSDVCFDYEDYKNRKRQICSLD